MTRRESYPQIRRNYMTECYGCSKCRTYRRPSPLDWVRRYDEPYFQRFYVFMPWLLTAMIVLAVITCGQLFDLFTGRI